MRKIFTFLFALTAISASAQFSQSDLAHLRSISRANIPARHNTVSPNRSVTNISIDYDSFDHRWQLQHTPPDSIYYYSWAVNKNNDTARHFDLRYAVQTYDTLIDVNNNFAGTPKAGTTVRVDSFELVLAEANFSGLNDTLVVSIFDKATATITGTGINAKLNTIALWSDSIVSNADMLPDNTNFYNVPFYPNITLPAGHTFGIRVDFKGDTADQSYVLASFRDHCSSQGLGDTNKIAPRNSSFYWNFGPQSGFADYSVANQLVFNVTNTCKYFILQNFLYYPHLTLTTAGVPPPTVVTTAATNITSTTATINGTVNANGNSSGPSFDWGLTASYTNTATATPSNVTGSTVTAVYGNLTGLSPNTTYHFRIKATNLGGPANGGDLTFTTLASGGVCTPDVGVTSGLSPASANIPCISQGQAFTQTFTFVIPATVAGIAITTVHFDSIGNLPAGLTYAFNQTPATYAGGASGCFIVSGTTNAPCGQYQMPIYVTITTPVITLPGEISLIAAQYGLAGYEMRLLRVIGSGGICPAVNTSQTTPFISGSCGTSNLSVTISKTDVTCFGLSNGSATATATGGTTYTYAWNNGGNTATINNLAPGTYTVTATSAGQTATASVFILQPNAVTASTSSTPSACTSNTGTATVTPGGGNPNYTYLWSNSGTTATISNIAAGIYTVTVTDSHSCTGSATVTVSTPATFTLTVTTTNVSCFGQSTGSATATVTGGTGLTYAWSNAGTTSTISNIAAGTYNVTVTDGSGCTKSGSGTVTQPASALSLTTSFTQASCGQSNGSATVTPIGGTSGYSYLWSNNGTVATISNLGAANYTVTVTDSKACTATGSVTVTTPATFILAVTTTNVTCYGQSTGSATATVTGGTGITYLWNNSATTAVISNLAAGTYNVIVTDGTGCSKTASGTVTQPANPVSATATSTPSTCGASTGTATVTVTNNVGTPTYVWSNSGTTSTITGLAANNYSVTVTAGGCTATASTSVNNSNGPALNILHTDPTCFGSTNGSATSSVSGGTPGYTYLWSNSATGSSISTLAAGTYTLIVKDANNCSAFGSVTLVQPNPITLNETVVNVNCNGGQTGAINLAVAGGTGPYTYSWSNLAVTSSLSGLPFGNYTVTVTDAHLCTATSTYNITQPTALTVTTTATPSTGSNGTATAVAAGGTSPYNYSWNTTPGQNTATATGLAPGQYNVVVSDTKGCSATSTVTVVIVGIVEAGNEITNFSVFPNPATDKLNVVMELGNVRSVQLNVTDINGKIIYLAKEMAVGKVNYEINLDQFTPGVYIIEAIADKQMIRKTFDIIR